MKRDPLDPGALLSQGINPDANAGFNTARHLEHARQQAIERRLSEMLIVDTDAHHTDSMGISALPNLIKYIEDPVLRQRFESSQRTGMPMLFGSPNEQPVAGRLVRYEGMRNAEPLVGDTPRDLTFLQRALDAIGIDYQIVFPTAMLNLGMHPDPFVEKHLSWAYTRWFTEEIMPHEPRVLTMVYLPFNDPDASMRVIEHYTGKPGVVGFMVAASHYRPVHDNAYMKIYRALEEREMPLGFHATFHQREPLLGLMNRFISVHALGFPLFNLVHIINMVINGIPERFPKLKVVWIENGLAFLPFLMQRLDNEYLMRTSEAPLLKKLPSEYMRDFYYTSQPMESTNLEALELTMKMMNAETQLMFASDYPHWDFNLPSTIYDLPFLTDQAKRNILGENARRVFKLPGKPEARR